MKEEQITSVWAKYSVIIKLILIGILALFLLIPASMIQSIIHERETLNEEVIDDIYSKWAGNQELQGPILTIPLVYEEEVNKEKVLVTKYYHILPEELNVSGNIEPEILERGIYEGVVYRSSLNISGSTRLIENINKENLVGIKENAAFLTFGISDLRGIEDEVKFQWDKTSYPVQPGTSIAHLVAQGFQVPLRDFSFDTTKTIPFSIQLKLKGSHNLSFLPLGKTTSVNLQSSWQDPKFGGNFLPNTREVNEEGFQAQWKILELNRNFPQSWVQGNLASSLKESAFGVELISPMDDYQKSNRSTKYAIMTIGLTFLMFFLVEILGKQNIHPLQYAMVGVAICLFYILLISISEHTNFDFAYVISSVAIITMICLYAISLLNRLKYVLILGLILIGSFGFLFVTINSQDYALLLGSLGLFIILGTTMYLTRNIDWYRISGS
ncbi:MAG TPA: cell envelope integrity protein CreD [Lunatimonas sp.]|nr:cell envelope integrity protein CreD [Lunatimonas sp.]